MDSRRKKISVAVPTKDRPQDLARCLESILNQTLLPDEIIIVDAGNAEESAPEIKNLLDGKGARGEGSIPFHRSEPGSPPTKSLVFTVPPHTRLMFIYCGPGLAYGRNVGVVASSGDVLFFFDDDVALEKDYLAKVMDIFDHDPEKRIGGVSGRQISPPKQEEVGSLRSILVTVIQAVTHAIDVVFLLWKRGNGTFRASGFPNYPYVASGIKQVEFLSGTSSAYRREVFTEFQFDEALPGTSICEDDDFSYRVSRKYVNMYTPYARLIHYGSPVARNSYQRDKMHIENRYYLFKKNFPQTLKYRLAFDWAMVGLCIEAVFSTMVGRSISPLRGYLAGLVSVVRHPRQLSQRGTHSARF